MVGTALALMLPFAAGLARAQGGGNEEQGYGIWVGPLNISPFLNLSAFYDSNVDFVRKGEESDPQRAGRDKDTRGFAYQPGVNLKVPGTGWGLEGRAYYQVENYRAEFAETRKDWSEMLAFFAETESGMGLRISELYQHVSQEDLDWEDRWNDRTEGRLMADLGKPVTEKTTISLSGSYAMIDYDDEQLFDWDQVSGGLTLAYKLTDKTDGLLVGGLSSSSSEDQDGSARSVMANVGFASRATEKTSYRTTVGLVQYSGFENDSSEVGLSYNLGINWVASEFISFNLSGNSSYEPAEDVEDNSMLVSTLGLGMTYRPLSHWELLLRASYRREDYTNPVQVDDNLQPSSGETAGGGEDRLDNQLNGEARVIFALNSYASLFVDGTYTYSTSSLEEFDYKRWRGNVGLALKY